MSDPVLPALWQEVDRVALCVHRPTGSNPEFRSVVDRLRIPAGSVLVAAARHLAAGRLTLEQLELLGRYESRSVMQWNVQRHVELGLLNPVAEDTFVPSEPFRHAARVVLDFQARSADELWAAHGGFGALVPLASSVVERAAAALPIPGPAFIAQRADHGTTPSSPAGQLLAYVTELRYLRSDLHAHALGLHHLAGPTARAVDRMWKDQDLTDEDFERLSRKGLVENGREGWRLTDAAREAREQAERETDRLSAVTFAPLAAEVLALRQGLAELPGDDPRPADAR